ncbi:MAG: oxidoreductase [Actinomycetota bacterium]|nr:oxidoreductase [Actinomycetota bacterium]
MALVSNVVLITGCSTGIGRATAERLIRAGFDVFATARRPETLEELEGLGCRTLALDVTDEESMVRAVRSVVDTKGAVGVLVNNAGYGEYGPVEESSADALRQQLETNVVGLTRLTQLVLPQMRAQRWGRIINLGSISGKISLPGCAYYSASKYAVEAISDALRFEVRPFGIAVSLIEPGAIKTAFDEAGLARLRASTREGSPYKRYNDGVAKGIAAAYEGAMGKMAGSPDDVARVIERAIRARRPRSRYRVGGGASLMLATRKLLPDRAMDLLLRSQFPSPARDSDERTV